MPLLFGIVLTVVMFLTNPDISNFNPDAEYEGSIQEIIATYAGRFVITSLYLLIFAFIDNIPPDPPLFVLPVSSR